MDYPNTNKINESRAFLAESQGPMLPLLIPVIPEGRWFENYQVLHHPSPTHTLTSHMRKWGWFAQGQPVSQNLRKVKGPSALIGSVI